MRAPILALLAATAQPPQLPGMHEQALIHPELGRLRYTLSLPDDYERDRPRPLVLALHYAGEVTPFYGKGLLIQLIEPALKDLSAILVAPDCPARGWANETSERAVMAILQQILDVYPIDRRRVVVTGYSMGGRGTWYMASRHRELFSAAIPIAGSPTEGSVERLAGLPMYVIHGGNDSVVSLLPTRDAVESLRAAGAPVELVIVKGAGHYEVPRFVSPLKKAVGWLRKIWSK